MIPVLLLLSFAPATCGPEDHRCEAERYIALAGQSREAGDHAGRALRLYLAHREYLYLFDGTGDSGPLCRARSVLKEALAVRPMPPHLVEKFRKSAADGSAREREAKVKCAAQTPAAKGRQIAAGPKVEGESTPPAALAAAGEPPVAGAVTTPQSPAEPAPSPASSPGEAPAESAPSLSPTSPSLATPLEDSPPTPAVRSTSVLVLDTDLSPAPADGLLPVTRRSPSAPAAPPRHPGRGLVIAGGVMLSAGVGLAAAASYMGHGLLETKRAADELHMTENPTDQQREDDRALWEEYRREGPPTLALALAGGASVLVAAILFGVGGKRMARAASHTAFMPMPGGFAVRMKF